MGLLSCGTPLNWEDAKPLAEKVRAGGVEQLIRVFERLKDRTHDYLKWGDEVEYIVVRFGNDKSCHVTVRAEEMLEQLKTEMAEKSHSLPECCTEAMESFTATWHPEYGRYMLEATPAKPYRHDVKDLLCVERDMTLRRRQAELHLRPNESLLAIGNFPRLGCKDAFADPLATTLTNEASRSLFFPDEFINKHPRFKTITRNIRERRGEKVCIELPLFRDTNTKMVVDSETTSAFPGSTQNNTKRDTIYMDAMGFGMGCCCLQITFQARDILEARHLYDQLAMALTASTPIYRGYLADVDCRWNVISASVDDRTNKERVSGSAYIPKSRYASISRFIAMDPRLLPQYNDLNVPYNGKTYDRLIEAGFDDLLAKHFAWLFIRDPLVIFSELVDQDNNSSDHFENIQSTNWQTMRFKPPPAEDDSIGWRVEFRPMEVQPTEFENAAFSVFIVLLTRIILVYNLNFYMPLSLVDENMQRAHRRDSLKSQRFHFPCDPYREGCADECLTELTVNDIINGSDKFVGLATLVDQYLDSVSVDETTRGRLSEYLTLIRMRASGELLTPASWMRNFVQNHPGYQRDSVVTPEITFDLMKEVDRITHESQFMSRVDFCSHYSVARQT
ncbi:Glutamate--cysteine ligase [Paramicrosporidium saccamoebae]|uniref:Glutamate--cysteine ligase n=1 Tax=Paramicrosporidium saccamoebae TaxID=1246581 RepID=A0A2H9TL49_9FUNG|nr:Glutamate--cysteine ligase [Paramicrosporidium saccamoebae]